MQTTLYDLVKAELDLLEDIRKLDLMIAFIETIGASDNDTQY